MSQEPCLGELILLLAVVWAYVVAAPFTKVEESFNTQAIRDVMKLGWKREMYDHLEFPGVVPRTFLGAVGVALLTVPWFHLCTRALRMTDLVGLYLSRFVLGLLSVMSFARMQGAVQSMYGVQVGRVFMLLTAAQFHLPFYMSRALPNTFALILTNWALADWIEDPRRKRSLYILIFAMVCFRCDILLLIVPILLHLILTKQLTFLTLILHGSLAGGMSVMVTVLVDSWFWKRWLWPEGEVFYFNAILQKSVEWGAMPYHWYFSSALPRSLLMALPLSCVAPFLDRRLIRVTSVAFTYVLLYSRLSHKEVRFLFPVLPLFNVSAAAACVRFVRNRGKGMVPAIVFAVIVAGSVLTLGVTMLMLLASTWNYPGGHALNALHVHNQYSSFVQPSPCHNATSLTVHIGTLPAMTGISRFAELSPCFSYSKTEGLTPSSLSESGFIYLITEHDQIPGLAFGDGMAEVQMGVWLVGISWWRV